MVLGSIASFAAAVGLLYRLGRLCFGPVVGLVAALFIPAYVLGRRFASA